MQWYLSYMVNQWRKWRFGRITRYIISKNNFFSGAILAGAIGISVGNAYAQKLDSKRYNRCWIGESACDVGLFWESINYAFLKKLPILFICENNNYSVFSPQNKRQAGSEIFEKVKGFGGYSEKVFGNNICDLYTKLEKIIRKMKKIPILIF